MGKSLLLWIFFPGLMLHSQTSTAFTRGSDTTITNLQQLLQSSKDSYHQGQYTVSIKYLEKALQKMEEIKDRTGEADIYNSLGRNYCSLGDLSKGFENYYKALQISEKLGDKKEMARCYQYIGTTFLDLKDDSTGLKHVFIALQLNLETGNEFGYAQNNNTIAEVYLKNGHYADGINKFRESLKIYEKEGAPVWGVPWCFNALGIGFERLGDSAVHAGNPTAAALHYKESLKNHLISLKKYQEIDIKGGYSEQHMNVGAIYFKLKKIPEAKKYLQTALQFLKEIGSKDIIAKVYGYLSKIDVVEGNYEKAFAHLQASNLYKDSVFNSEEYNKANLYKTRYEIDKKEEEIKLLAAENKLKAAVADKQKQQKIFAYAAIFLVLLLGNYVFYRYRFRKKTEMEQAKLKDRLQISQGLHDDIGSTLSSISVYTQVAQKLNEKNYKQELDEMLSKINETSFEMISEMNDIVWTIHPKNDSMEKIVQRMESYAKPMLMTRNIDFSLEYEPVVLTIHLEMEKRKNSYLVFKEAVNNAFKYSGCSQITTRILNRKGWMEIQIKDNGVGFDVKHEMAGDKLTLSGNGLRNMKMRAEEMKGDLKIDSIVGQGTEVKLSFPIP